MIDGQSFSNLMDGLRALYPALFRMKIDEKARRDHAFWQKMQRYDAPTIKRACDLASERHPDRFPTAGQLIACCKDAMAEARRETAQHDEHASSEGEDAEIMAAVKHRRDTIIPRDKEEQWRWCQGARSPYERLARIWECESKNNGWAPDKPSPRGVGERRMAEFQELMADLDRKTKLDPNQKPRVEPKKEREPGED